MNQTVTVMSTIPLVVTFGRHGTVIESSGTEENPARGVK